MTRRRLAAIFFAVYVAVVIAVTGATYAAAQTDSAYAAQQGLCQRATDASGWVDKMGVTGYLPVNRWASAVSMHSRLPGLTDVGSWGDNLRQWSFSNSIGIGNSAFSMAANLVEKSTRFCVADSVGAKADQATVTLGNAVVDSGLFAGLIIIAVLALIWRASRGQSPVRGLVKLALVAGLAVMMVAGAGGTASDGSKFGALSPGWFAVTTNKVVSAAAAAPAAAIDNVVLAASSASTWQQQVDSNRTDCSVYNEVLRREYVNGFRLNAGGWLNQPVAPEALDTLWTSSGYKTWSTAQFGDNPYGQKVACRLLEYSAGSPVHQGGTAGVVPKGMMDLTARLPDGASDNTISDVALFDYSNANALAWSTLSDSTLVDRAMVGWAACNVDRSGNITVDPAWDGDQSDNQWIDTPVTVDDCTGFFTKDAQDWDAKGSSLDFGDDVKANIKRTANSPKVQQFILALHQNQTANTGAVIYAYAISSIVAGLVFIAMGLAVFVAKLALMILAVLAFMMLLVSLVRVDNPGSGAGQMMKHFLVVSVFAFGAGFLLSLVALLSVLIAQLGSGFTANLGDAGMMSALWVGLSPVAAIVVMHLVFTRMLHVPSPFTPQGALAWGAAAAGTSMLTAGRISDRLGNKMDEGRRAAWSAASGAVGARNGPGRRERTGGMQPVGDRRAESSPSDRERFAKRPDDTSASAEELTKAAAWKARGGKDLPTVGKNGKPLNAAQRALADRRMRLAEKLRQLKNITPGSVKTAAGRRLRSTLASGAEAIASGAGRTWRNVTAHPLKSAGKLAGLGAVAALTAGTPVLPAILAAAGARAAWRNHQEASASRKLEDEYYQATYGMSKKDVEAAGIAHTEYQQYLDETTAQATRRFDRQDAVPPAVDEDRTVVIDDPTESGGGQPLPLPGGAPVDGPAPGGRPILFTDSAEPPTVTPSRPWANREVVREGDAGGTPTVTPSRPWANREVVREADAGDTPPAPAAPAIPQGRQRPQPQTFIPGQPAAPASPTPAPAGPAPVQPQGRQRPPAQAYVGGQEAGQPRRQSPEGHRMADGWGGPARTPAPQAPSPAPAPATGRQRPQRQAPVPPRATPAPHGQDLSDAGRLDEGWGGPAEPSPAAPSRPRQPDGPPGPGAPRRSSAMKPEPRRGGW